MMYNPPSTESANLSIELPADRLLHVLFHIKKNFFRVHRSIPLFHFGDNGSSYVVSLFTYIR